MSMKKIIKGSLISLAVLGMIGGSVNGNIANAKHRHVRYTHRIKRTRRHSRRSRLYRRHGKIRYSYRYRSHRHARHYAHKYTAKKHAKKSYRHSKYAWILNYNPDGSASNIRVKVIGHGLYNTPLVRVLNNEVAAQSGRNEYIASNKLYSSKSQATAAAHKVGLRDEPLSKSNKAVRRKHASQKAETHRTIGEIKSQTLADINNDRESHGLQPVQESPAMDQIADMRAKQDVNYDSHYDPNTNQSYELEDANKLGVQFGKGDYIFTENLGGYQYGSNGKDIADKMNDTMMNHDQASDNGHRKNILYAPWRYVGIGSAPCKGEYSGDYNLAEDFATYVNK